jgi:hypothetical protein
VLPDPHPQPHVDLSRHGGGQQLIDVDCLHVARTSGWDRDRTVRDGRDRFRRGQVSDHRERVALDHPHDVVHLQRVGEVVGEEHQQRQAEEQQPNRDRHGEPGERVDPLPGGHPHLEQAARGVGEGADEDAEHDLVGAVPQEIAQQPRGELCR